MAKTIKQSEVIQKDFFKEPSKSAKEFLGVLEELGDQFKETAKEAQGSLKAITIDTAAGIKLVNAEVTNSIKLRKADEDVKKKQAQTELALVKILEAELKAEQQLNKTLAEAEKVKQQTIKTKEQAVKQDKRIQQDREKQIKKQITLEKKELDAFQKKSKKLNELRKRFKALSASEGKSSKETKKLGKQVKKLDKELKEIDESAGQFQRNVGNYPDTLGKAAKSILGIAAAAASAAGAFEGIKGSLESTAEGSENVREVTSILGGVWDQVSNVVAGAALDVIDYGTAVVESVNSGDDLIDSLTGQENQFKRTTEATTDFIDKTKESIDGQLALTNRLITFEKAVRPLELRIATLNGLIEEQGVIAGDSTRSFEELNNAILEGQLLQVDRAKINISIAREELAIVQDRIALKNLAGGAGVELLDAETAALIKLKEARIDLKIETLESEKELRQIKQDRLEKDLDILIDGFDNQKTINERIIANDKETLKKRSELLVKTNQLANDSFRAQKDALEELSAAGIDIDDLLLLDATQLQKQIRLLEQSEIIEGRTLEVVRERRIVIQDLADAQSDLNDAQIESLEIITDLNTQQEILNQLEIGDIDAKNKALKDLDLDREQNEIDLLRRRLENVKDGSLEELRIKQELNDALLNQKERLFEDEKALQEKADSEALKAEGERQQQIKDNLNTTVEIFKIATDAISANLESEIENGRDKIKESQSAIDTLKQQAILGNADAKESIKAEKLKIANEKERIESLEKKKRDLLIVVAGLELLSQKINSGDQNATSSASNELSGFISGLKGAYEGTDINVGQHFGNAIAISGDKDTHIGKFHKDEKILSVKNSRKIQGMNQDDITQGALLYRDGQFANQRVIRSLNTKTQMDDSRLISYQQKTIEAINNIKIPEHNFNYDAVTKMATESIRLGNLTTRTHKKMF